MKINADGICMGGNKNTVKLVLSRFTQLNVSNLLKVYFIEQILSQNL